MNWKERILSTIKGKPTDSLPFVPRLDLWYKANKHNNTLPDIYSNATLEDITDDLQIGYHSVIPDFRDFTKESDNMGFALGMLNLNNNSYRIDFSNIDFEIDTSGELTIVKYFTPHGEITTRALYDERMRQAGATIGHTVEHAIKDSKDIDAAGYIFENVIVEQAYNNFSEYQKKVGDRGIAAAFNLLSVSPINLIMKELIHFDHFVYQLHDDPGKLELLAEKIDIFFNRVFDIVLDSSAEVILSGANYDRLLTWPPFFKKYITPHLGRQSRKAHLRGKFLLTHTDGENKGLLEEYTAAGIDIADSICPYPMTKYTLKEIRKIFDGRITIWGGIPSVIVLEESMSDYEFEKYINGLFEDIGCGDHLILSFADTTPPDARLDRIKKVAGLARDFGPVKPG